MDVQFEFSIKDMMSRALDKIKKSGKEAFEATDKANQKFDQGLKNTNKDLDKTASGFNSIKGLATRVFAGLAIGSTIKSMAELSIEAEQNKIAFTTFLGSGEAANTMLKELGNVAATTPFGKREIIDTAKTLMGFGVTADKMKPTLRALGDVSSGTGKNFKELAVIFGQVKSVGKLMGGDLMQLRQSGIPIVKELSKNLGVSEAQISEMVSKGKIGFADVEKAFMTMTSQGGMFFNLMDAQSKSLGGRISSLQDAFADIGTAIADKYISPVIGAFVDFVNEFMSNLEPVKNAFKSLMAAFQPIADGINELGIAFGFWSAEGVNGANVAQGLANVIRTYLVPVVTVAANVFKTLTSFISRNSEFVKGLAYAAAGAFVFMKAFAMIKTAITIVQSLKAAFIAFNAVVAANPISMIVLAIGALVGMFIYAWNEVEGFKESILGLWEAGKYAFQNLGTFIPKVLSNIAKFFADTFQPFFDAFQAFKDGEYGKAAKLAGVGLLKVATVPARLMYDAVTGDLFKGTGADEVFTKTKERELEKTRKAKELEALQQIVKQNEESGAAQAASTIPAVTPSSSTGGTLSDTASRVSGGNAPTSVNVYLQFGPEAFKYEVNSVAESQQTVVDELGRIMADIANMTGRSYK